MPKSQHQSNDNVVEKASSRPITITLDAQQKHVQRKYPIFTILEGLTYVVTYCKIRVRDSSRETPYQSFTKVGRLNHYLVTPIFNWFEHNDRVILSASTSPCYLKDEDGSSTRLINGSSHNYAGFYELSSDDQELHRKCLDLLPLSNTSAVSFLHDLMIEQLKTFFNAQSCYSSNTGFGSNMLGIPAVAGKDWLIVVDEKCHNSIFTGAFAAGAKAVRRFKHNDMASLQRILREAKQSAEYKDTLVIVEGVYSMDATFPHFDILQELKIEFAFLLFVDEAHSFGSVGRTGHGCIELWNDEHPNKQVPDDLVDIRSAVLSKAVGGIGGFVCCKSGRFEEALRRRAKQLEPYGESLTTATILMTLRFLQQPKRLKSNLHRLREISAFCHGELAAQGVVVYGDKTYLPILPVMAGRPSKGGELSHRLREKGVVSTPITIPAVKFWECRVRVVLSASYTDEEVDHLVSAIVTATRHLGLGRETKIPRRKFHLPISTSQEEIDDMEKERHEMHRYIDQLLDEQIKRFAKQGESQMPGKQPTLLSADLIEAGQDARRLYGVGSGSARWILGTFPPHLSVEAALSKIHGQEAAVTYPDSMLGLMSSVAGLFRPILGYKKHYFLCPAALPAAVEEGIRIVTRSSGTTCTRYSDAKSLVSLINNLRSRNTYLTIYLESESVVDLVPEMASTHLARASCTLFVNDFAGLCLSKSGVDNISRINSTFLPSARLLFSGSFFNYCKLPGGYLVGDAVLIEELRYTSRCYLFTTSPMPWIMAMIDKRIAGLVQGN